MSPSRGRQLTLLRDAFRALQVADSLHEVKSIRDKAEAVRQYARTAALGLDVQNYAAEVKLRAERKAGQLIAELHLRGGDRRSSSHNENLKLADLGILSDQSARWQQQAAIPEKTFEQYVRSAKQQRAEITTKGLLKLARRNTAGPPARRRKPVFVDDQTSIVEGAEPSTAGARDDRHSSSRAVTRHLESLREVMNHCQLLSQILNEETTDEPSTPPPEGRRIAKRLVGEIHRLTGGVVTDIERSV